MPSIRKRPIAVTAHPTGISRASHVPPYSQTVPPADTRTIATMMTMRLRDAGMGWRGFGAAAAFIHERTNQARVPNTTAMGSSVARTRPRLSTRHILAHGGAATA